MHSKRDLLLGALVLSVIGVGPLCCLTGCGYAKHKDPITYTESSPKAAEEAARLYAKDIFGTCHQNHCCGSMEPLIHAGDWIVVKQTLFGDNLLGCVVDYKATWHKDGLIEHRLVSGDAKGGFIPSGDNNRYSEPQERVTAANYFGEVVAIYRSP